VYICRMIKKEETVVRGWRIKKKTLEQLNKMRLQKYGNFVKMNGYVQMVFELHIEREQRKK